MKTGLAKKFFIEAGLMKEFFPKQNEKNTAQIDAQIEAGLMKKSLLNRS